MTKKQKQPLFLRGYETNPQGEKVPIFTTVEPTVPYEMLPPVMLPSESPSLPGARLKKKKKGGK